MPELLWAKYSGVSAVIVPSSSFWDGLMCFDRRDRIHEDILDIEPVADSANVLEREGHV
jgi:hypothetical protein